MASHSRGTSLRSPQQGSTNRHLRAPQRPGLLLPYKRAGQGSITGTEDNEQQITHKSQAKCQALQGSSAEINISSNHLCTLSSLFETWVRGPLSQACNPYTSTSVQENTKLSPPAGRRAFFCPNQDKPPSVLLASPSRIGTRSTHSSV
jgi:hypothetical protein